MRTINYKRKFGKLMEELIRDYPSFSLGRHLSTALSDYGDFWGISDKSLCDAIEEYQKKLALDITDIAPDEFVYRIQQDAEHLFDLTDEEQDYN